MPLSPGSRLGHYDILAAIGEGGMGAVYRARDTKLGREVAVKLLPDAFAEDPDRLARLHREARVLASLNHPNIAAIYDLEEIEGVRFLVLELVPGETLEEKLNRGPLPLGEVLPVFHQIAEGLEAAHEKTVVHRDLKPANIKITPEGKVKVLDFGLAKALAPDPSGPHSESRTLTYQGTREGSVIGTAAYMSPEQARGKSVDKQTDIWAFGCVLYEALTGIQAFAQPTFSDTIAAVLEREPDWALLPDSTPREMRRLLKRCLQKDPHRRLHDIADARIDLEEVPGRGSGAAVGGRLVFGWAALAAVISALAAGLLTWRLASKAPAPSPGWRFDLALPHTTPLSTESQPLAISGDGARVVYAANQGSKTALYLWGAAQTEATLIPGSDGGQGPFFSPDGTWLGFFSEGKLKKIALSSATAGGPLTVCESPESRGASWGLDDKLLFAAADSGLRLVPAAGGAAAVATTPDPARAERTHRWPQVLPGGKAVLFTVGVAGQASYDEARVAAEVLATGERRVVLEGGTFARYVPSGHLVYARAGTLYAAPFDPNRLTPLGSPVAVLEDVFMDPLTGAAFYSFSENGTLVYAAASKEGAVFAGGAGMLLWADRDGKARPLADARRGFAQPRLSPDGKRLALTVTEGAEKTASDVWIADVERGALTRLTFDKSSGGAIWSPDGKELAFTAERAGGFGVSSKAADGSGAEKELFRSEHILFLGSWSPDGRALTVTESHLETGLDIWLVEPGGKRRPLLASRFDEGGGLFSPDGRTLAYVSNESGRDEVYLRAYPGPGPKLQVSTEGGTEPVWARNGREILYRHQDGLMAVTVETSPSFAVSKPRLLFQGGFDEGSAAFSNYDVDLAGERFILIRSESKAAPTELKVIQDWVTELARRVPAPR
jgi:serine/threonine-protein kinase